MSNRIPFVPICCNVRASIIFDDISDAGMMWFCLMCASHNEFNGLLPGQFYVSKAEMAKRLHIGRDALNARLHSLEQAGLISVEASVDGTTITVRKWKEWSAGNMPDGLRMIDEGIPRSSNPYAAPRRTAWSAILIPSGDTVAATDNTVTRHIPERKQKDTDNIPSVSLSPSSCAADFDKLWFAYPAQRRNRKAEAGILYERAIQNGATIEAMMKALDADMKSVIWEGGQGKYVPGIVKWLEREAWRDYAAAEEEYVCQEI